MGAISKNRIIFAGLGPLITVQSVITALAFLCLPWRWIRLQKGDAPKQVEQWLRNFLGTKAALTFDSGRSALIAAFFALGIKPGDEVLVQAFTCIVVINAIRHVGATPVYVDIDDSYCMDVIDVRKKITPQTRVILIQHTFGTAADLDQLLTLAKESNLCVVEDCALALGATYNGKKVGTFGDMAIVSFGSEKVLSSGRGGALLVNNEAYLLPATQYQAGLPPVPLMRVVQQLLTFLVLYLGKNTYRFGLGKIFLVLTSRIGLISKLTHREEKQGRVSPWTPARFPNVLAIILKQSTDTLSIINEHRQTLARMYDKLLPPTCKRQLQRAGGVFIEYSILVKEPETAFREAKKQGIFLNQSWSGAVVVPKDSVFEAAGYMSGSCPKAESIARHCVNLPTHPGITEQDAIRIANFIKKYW